MKSIKPIAIYLPQYYETEYNNKWWGKGFTDWTAVKKATPCFDGHIQPKVPLNKYYYDLLDKNTLLYQEELMKKYGIYGLCFYHYYFKDGVKVLERPAENLLKWKEIDIPFCFSWPSEKWIRTWSNFYGNVWGEKFDKDSDRAGDGVLLEQDFGLKNEWKAHFEYLLQFFKDERYIKFEGRPIFIFHHTEQVSCIKEMTGYWIELAKENGLAGMYFIGSNVLGYREELDAILMNEPTHARKKLLEKGAYTVRNGVTCYKYSDFVEEVLGTEPLIGTKTYFCGVPGYDTTPRRGKNGECLLDNTSDLFEKLMDGLYKKTIENGNEYIFINAWNEWGEGTYLEPDEEKRYATLEVVRKVSGRYAALTVSGENEDSLARKEIASQINQLNDKVNKFRWLYENAISFASIIQNAPFLINKYFARNDLKKISIYGVGPIGKLLISQLMNENIEIAYTVDIYAARVMENIPMFRPYEELPQTDILIVTAYGAEKIIADMNKKGLRNVVSIESWLNSLRG